MRCKWLIVTDGKESYDTIWFISRCADYCGRKTQSASAPEKIEPIPHSLQDTHELTAAAAELRDLAHRGDCLTLALRCFR